MIHLNHAGTSWPKPDAVRSAAVRSLAAPPETWSEDLARDHAAVCRALGAPDPSRLLITPGGTSALAIGIADHPWSRGDRVLVSAWEHHALQRPVQLLANFGVEVEVLPGRTGEPVDLEALDRSLARGGARLLAFTAACNVTGELLPVREMVDLARRHGVPSLVDAAQVTGWLDLDMASYGADLVAFTGHKGPQAPWGVGGLYVAPGVTLASPNASCELPAGDAAPCSPMPGYCDAGSVNRPALAGLAAGFAWLAEPERADRLAVARDRIGGLQERLAGFRSVHIHGDPDPARRMPTLAVTLDDHDPSYLERALRERGVAVSGGHQCAPVAHASLGTERDGVVRISIGPTTDETEWRRAEAILLETLMGGQR